MCLKTKEPNTYNYKGKKNKDTEHHPANKNPSRVICMLPYPSVIIFSWLSYQDSTLFRSGTWLSELSVKCDLLQHTVKTNRLVLLGTQLFVYVFRKTVRVKVHFLWSLLYFRWNRWLSKINICMWTVKCSCVSLCQCKGWPGHQYLSTNYFLGKIRKILI